MRTMIPLAAAILMLIQTPLVLGGDGCAVGAPTCGIDADLCGGGCCRGGFGLLGRHGCGYGGDNIDGLDPHFNCGCRGSYNYPVPPQYTYHWPGMYKQNLMTDYTSPWRFPPLKAYVDEQPLPAAEAMLVPTLQTISATEHIPSQASRSGEIEPVSSRLLRGR
jgi:hypothetical protein